MVNSALLMMACPIHSLQRIPFQGSASLWNRCSLKNTCSQLIFLQKMCLLKLKKRVWDPRCAYDKAKHGSLCHIFCHDSSCEITETSAELQFPLSEMVSIKKWDFPSGTVSASEAHWPQLLLAFNTMDSFVLTCWQMSLPSFRILYITVKLVITC